MFESTRVLVVGAGSIGMRHIGNLQALGVQVSAYRQRPELRESLADSARITVYASLDEALADHQDAAVVCTTSDQHVRLATQAATAGLHLYIEKPIGTETAGLEALSELVHARKLVVEVGYMLREHPGLRAARDTIEAGRLGRVLSARAWVGQDLRTWRDADYRKSYSAFPEKGGGVLFDLSHEIDYLAWLLGPITEVSAFADHLSDLATSAEDVAQLLVRFAAGATGQVHLDCVRPGYGRGCEIVGTQGALAWDYVRGLLTLTDTDGNDSELWRQPEAYERNQMFKDHMQAFVERVNGEGEVVCGLDDAIHALEVVLAAKRSAVERRTVSV